MDLRICFRATPKEHSESAAGIVVLVIGATLEDDILILRVSYSVHGYSMYRKSVR